MKKIIDFLKNISVARLVLILSILILVIIVAVPVLLILFTAFFENGKLNVAGVVKVLSDKDTYSALLNSLIIAIGTTFISTLFGVFFAWLVARTDLPFKKFMKIMFLVPFMLPSFIGALAWKILLSPNAGYINRLFVKIFNLSSSPIDIMTMGGIIAIESMYLFPFVFLQVTSALERMDPTLEESARISGAGYPNGEGFPVIEFTTDPGNHVGIFEAVQQMWKEHLNIDSSITQVDNALLGQRLLEKKFMIGRLYWSSDYMDPMSMMSLFVSYNTQNNGGYSNKKYDELIERAASTGEQIIRMAAMHEAEKIFIEDMGAIPIYFYTEPLLVNPKLKGVVYNPLGFHRFNYAYLEK